jgi:hypothetical protein
LIKKLPDVIEKVKIRRSQSRKYYPSVKVEQYCKHDG